MLPAFLIVLLLGATAHGTQQGKGTKLLLDAFYVFSLSLTAMMSNTVQLLNLGSWEPTASRSHHGFLIYSTQVQRVSPSCLLLVWIRGKICSRYSLMRNYALELPFSAKNHPAHLGDASALSTKLSLIYKMFIVILCQAHSLSSFRPTKFLSRSSCLGTRVVHCE